MLSQTRPACFGGGGVFLIHGKKSRFLNGLASVCPYFEFMTRLQRVFIDNLRFWRKKRDISQVKLAEMLSISPNYLNAVENGKNFPSPEVIQRICDSLGLMPCQLFLEYPAEAIPSNAMVKNLMEMKQRFIREIDVLIDTYE